MLSVLMKDELVDQFNYKGILGKLKLQGNKIMDIIHGKFQQIGGCFEYSFSWMNQ